MLHVRCWTHRTANDMQQLPTEGEQEWGEKWAVRCRKAPFHQLLATLPVRIPKRQTTSRNPAPSQHTNPETTSTTNRNRSPAVALRGCSVPMAHRFVRASKYRKSEMAACP